MPLEIERHFLVKVRLLPQLEGGNRLEQAYLSVTPEVRVRVVGDERAYITIKSEGNIRREEYEYAVPVDHARSMLALTSWAAIRKTRYSLPLGNHVWEIDRYDGENEGLWSAEAEMASEDDDLVLPPWLGEEVTEDNRFRNKNLAQQPFSAWPDRERYLAAQQE
jgi:CYTH domain-containing protein